MQMSDFLLVMSWIFSMAMMGALGFCVAMMIVQNARVDVTRNAVRAFDLMINKFFGGEKNDFRNTDTRDTDSTDTEEE